MNANDITFGIEIECAVEHGCCIPGGYHRGNPVEWLPAGWTAEHDSSLTSPAGKMAVEFVSPKLKGADGLRQIIAVCTAIKERGGVVILCGGVHIHVGFPRQNTEAIERLLHLGAESETAIYASTGTRSRENGRWCRGVRRHDNATQALRGLAHDRYHVLNLQPLVSGRRPAVEFRAFGGSLNAAKLIAYVRMCVGIVERSIEVTAKSKWTGYQPKPGSSHDRGGAGLTQMNRLFYRLGWTKGSAKLPKPFGGVGLEAEDLPTLKNHKSELRRLAKKYDAST